MGQVMTIAGVCISKAGSCVREAMRLARKSMKGEVIENRQSPWKLRSQKEELTRNQAWWPTPAKLNTWELS